MRRSTLALSSCLFLLAGAASAQAAVLFTATLSNAQENPPVRGLATTTGAPRPTSSGTATLLLNDAMTALTFSATLLNIDVTGSQTADTNDNLAAGHIHASATGTALTNSPIVFGFFGALQNDIAPNDVVLTPFASGVGGTISGKWDALEGNGTTLTAQLSNLLAGRAYLNFHTRQFPTGEIRGTVTPVPEPASLALLGAGAALAALRRRPRTA